MRAIFTLLAGILAIAAFGQSVTIGSKKFTESYVLGEIGTRLAKEAGLEATHKKGIGSTGIVWAALTSGAIQAYPDYTGTVGEELLKAPKLSQVEMREKLKALGIGMSEDLGFNDSYGLAMRKEEAEKLGIKTISDLAKHPSLTAGITPELINRSDGWRPLSAKYGLKLADTKSVEHGLGYAALYAGQVDVKDCYTTDAEIAKYNLTVLKDDLNFFPQYRAVWLYRLDAPKKLIEALDKMVGKIDESAMIAMNKAANDSKDPLAGAALFFAEPPPPPPSMWAAMAHQLGQHLALVGASLLLAILVGIPLGMFAARPGATSSGILGFVGVLQTIPSLALLAFLVPVLGIGAATAVAALFLYSLLPIVRNTSAGLRAISGPLREAAEAIGLPAGARLRKVYLPMALPTILAGIKTSAVINVGTATLAALIGAGGFGEPIVQGISLTDNGTILRGAIPAAILAVLVQLLFDGLERLIVSPGLRTQGV
ncbi:ABC transporter permease subunit [bacterium]|nr:MAG: ABC transporter permease subunit [bacterium]